jgi:hypothetical protein
MGFAVWGHEARNALDPRKNASTVEVMGERIPRDKRGTDRLTSEPVVLMGLEVGWTPEFRTIAEAMLRAQEARYKQTGAITIASEDAVQMPPHYFYYYTFWSDGKPFAVRAMGAGTEGPRWVSAKGAYAWHSLMPSAYTWSAIGAVEPARSAAGWSSGVYEENGKSTEVRNLNTAGVILQAALYREQGRPPLVLR